MRAFHPSDLAGCNTLLPHDSIKNSLMPLTGLLHQIKSLPTPVHKTHLDVAIEHFPLSPDKKLRLLSSCAQWTGKPVSAWSLSKATQYAMSSRSAMAWWRASMHSRGQASLQQGSLPPARGGGGAGPWVSRIS